MTEEQDQIRLKDLLDIFNKEDYKELIEILYRDQKRYHSEQLRLCGVGVRSEQLKEEKHLDKSDLANLGDNEPLWDNIVDAMNEALTIKVVIDTLVCDITKGTRCKDSFADYKDGKCRICGGQAN